MTDALITHHFLPGVYAKETRIPAGWVGVQHVHEHDHCSILTVGSVMVGDGVTFARHDAPAHLVIAKGRPHEVRALTDSVWFCIHATNETDETKIDEVLLCRGQQ